MRVSGLSGRLGNKILQHIDAFAYGESAGFDMRCSDRDVGLYAKRKCGIFHRPSIKKKWRLSECLFDENPIDIKKYFVTSGEIATDLASAQRKIALHFRGSDFAEWKAHSIISPSFFIEALEDIATHDDCIFLVTDDPDHPNVKSMLDELSHKDWNPHVFSGSQHADFMRLLLSSQVIASPSTFSLTASLLGGRSIVFPRAYAIKEASSGSAFWRDCVDGKTSHYLRIELR